MGKRMTATVGRGPLPAIVARALVSRGRRNGCSVMMQWIEGSLARKLTLRLLFILAVISMLFLLVAVLLYRDQLIRARADVLSEVNGLLQVSLENAMLKRDLPGLREIVHRFGERPDIVAVMIANPDREVRFASRSEDLGRVFSAEVTADCETCLGEPNELQAASRFLTTADGTDVLRSIVPVRNRAPCRECHGTTAEHPVNGVLIVDHTAGGLQRQALASTALLGGAGLIVLALTTFAGFAIIRRHVLVPIDHLSAASLALSANDLDRRVDVAGTDEIARLGETFNTMAERLAKSIGGIRERERFLQEMIDAIPDGVRVIDENFQVVMVNTAYCEQMDSPRGELLGVPCYAAHDRSDPCIASLITCPVVALKASDEPIKYIHRHFRPDKLEVIVETTAAPVDRIDETGARRRLIVEAMRDVSRQVRYSQEQRLAELGQLATGVAHEIYNPLSSARLGLQALLRDACTDRAKTDQVESYLKMVDGEIDKCIDVTRRLLSLGMPPSKHLQLVSLGQIIPEVVSLLCFEAEKLDIAVAIDLDDDLRVLATDSEMRMVFLNLVQNGFHAMPSGGRIAITGRSDGSEITVAVADTGVGIAAEDLGNIFDPFFSKRADDVEGTGLGLTICKATLLRYGGSISVDSTIGEGSTFTVTIPMAGKSRKDDA